MSPRSLPEEFQRVRRHDLRWALVAYLLVAVALAVSLYRQQQEINKGKRATTALCALQYDLERRVKAGEDFLEEHPRGVPGIPARTIMASIENQRSTIRTLEVLRCPPRRA